MRGSDRKAFCGGADDLVRNRANGAELLRDDKIRFELREQRGVEMVETRSGVNRGAHVAVDFGRAASSGPKRGGKLGQRERLERIIALVRYADDVLARADREENLGRARQQTDDPRRAAPTLPVRASSHARR